MNKRILVIGGAGYLGVVIVQKLLDNGYVIRIFDSFIYGHKPVQRYINDPRVEIIKGDIRNIEKVNSAMNDVSSVILLAAVVGDPASATRPEQTIETNYLASQAIASACKLKKINRFIYASTCSVYGTGKDILDETADLNPVSLYARTKIASESIINNLANDEFAPTIMRMSTLYGYSPRMRFDLVVNTMTMTAYLDKQIRVYGGNQWRPLLHIDDASEAYLKVLQADIELVRGKIYNVGSEEQNFQISDVARMISEALDGIEVKTELTTFDVRDYKVSFRRIQDELDFRVKNTLEEASMEIYSKLETGIIKDPLQKRYYNHYFDASEER